MPLKLANLQSRIDTLLVADDFGVSRWDPAFQTAPLTLTYRFETRAEEGFYWDDVAPPVSYTEPQKAAVRRALSKFEAVLNVDFVEDNGPEDPMFSFYRSPDIFTDSSVFGSGRGDFEFIAPTKDTPAQYEWDGAVVFVEAFDLAKEKYFDLILHEIGHALGLKHPGNYDIPGIILPQLPFLPPVEDNFKFTVMSYNQNPESKAKPAELMLYDVAALQQWWGPNSIADAGPTLHQPFADSGIKVIWDAGGVDKIRQFGSDPVKIDLRQGAFSSENGQDVAAIAFGTDIENARGAEGSDRIIGNDIGNRLWGAQGNDTLKGRFGDDGLQGGRGADRLFGGAGHDTLYGGLGKDIMKGGQGNDILIGHSGQDVFVFSRGADEIVDFADDVDSIEFHAHTLEGILATGDPTDADMIAGILAFANVALGNTIIDFGGGDILTIRGLTDISLLVDDIYVS